jgi:hypothetical protein
MITLSETRQALEARQARLTFTKIASREIRLSSEGLLLAGEQAFTLSLEARDDLARRSGIPAPFFNTIPVDLQAALFNRLFPVTLAHPAAPPELNVAVLDNRVAVALSDATLAVLPGVEVLNAVLEAASTDSNREVLDVAHFGLNGGISLSLVSPAIRAEPRVGDIVSGGIDVYHHDTGSRGCQVSSYLYRLVCRNGLLVPVCEHKEDLRIRRGGPETRDSVLRRVRHVAGLAWADLQAKLAVLKQLVDEPVDDPAVVLERIARDTGLNPSRKFIHELLAALSADEAGPGRTVYDMMNAISRVGTHSASRPLAWRERFERCPQCRSILRSHRT